jgi:predicted amidophosphoribosyltransferase
MVNWLYGFTYSINKVLMNKRRINMILCKKCSFENYDGTRFCQRCGKKLSHRGSFNLSGLAGMGMKGVSIAPLAARTVEAQATEEFKNSKISTAYVKTVPLEDGSWYCLNCGKYNSSFTLFCSGCGRDK